MRQFMISIALMSLFGNSAFGQVIGKPVEQPFPLTEARPFNFWMDVKLEKAQEIFGALTEADYETIIDCTKQLRTLSEFEAFVRKGTPGYLTQLRSFQFAVTEIEKQAQKENIEGVTLGFQQMTLSCVHCHNVLRETAPGKATGTSAPDLKPHSEKK